MKYSSLDLGTIEAVFNKLGGMEGARAFLRGEQKIVPISFECNEYGHIVLTFDGLDLTYDQEVKRLTDAGFLVSHVATYLSFTDDYDENHRLVAGQKYGVALMPTREIERDADRTIDSLRKRGIEEYGYGKPLAGIVPRIRETVSDEQMEEMGFWYITAPHDVIKDSDGDQYVLQADRDHDGSWLDADCADSDARWGNNGAFAFLIPGK